MSDEYLVWSNEHRAWWRPGGYGYSGGITGAGRFTREQALKICADALGTAPHIRAIAEIPVRLDDIYGFLSEQAVVPGVIWGDQ